MKRTLDWLLDIKRRKNFNDMIFGFWNEIIVRSYRDVIYQGPTFTQPSLAKVQRKCCVFYESWSQPITQKLFEKWNILQKYCVSSNAFVLKKDYRRSKLWFLLVGKYRFYIFCCLMAITSRYRGMDHYHYCAFIKTIFK